MKKAVVLFLICIFTGYGIIFAQDDGHVPFLSESDIIAIETVLPEDTTFILEESPPVLAGAANEMPRLNTSQPVYHLLVLDRIYSPDSDIGDVDTMQILYKYRHGSNGYLIALYVSPVDGPVFPQLPSGSRIILNLSTTYPAAIREYIDSNAFRRFVANRTILAQLQEALRRN